MAKRKYSAIRHLASTAEGKRIAAGEFEVVVSVWDLKTRRKISEFETPLDYGGSRLAINPRGAICAIASWRYRGVALYDAATAEVIGIRERVGRPQRVKYSPDGTRLYCCVERGPCLVLDGDSAALLGKYSAVRNTFCSRFGDLELREKSRRNARHEISKVLGKNLTSFERTTFAVKSADFGPDRVCLSESTGPVRCIDTENGREIWRYDPPGKCHVEELAYSEGNGHFHGVHWPYYHGGPKKLLRFDYQSGKVTVVAQLRHFAESVFCSKGNKLITSEGDVVNVENGASERAFTFPPAEKFERWKD
jgi:WD40 repeat protein